MPHRYENITKISTYKVDKELIKNIEDFYQVQIPQFLSIDQPLLTKLSVTIYTTLGNESYNTINDYRYPQFQNGTKAIAVEFSLADKFRGIVIQTRFDKNGENSFVSIYLYDNRGVELVQALEAKLKRTISAKKSTNWMFYPRESVLYPLYVIGLFVGLFGFASELKTAKPYCIGIVTLLLLYIGIFRFIKGYCSFDSLRQNLIDKVVDWFFLGVAGFILTCLLTPLGKILFGV